MLHVGIVGVQTDYAALREGSLQELVNLVDWANVVVRFKAVSLKNVHGIHAVLTLLGDCWISDIRSNQAVQMLEGAKPVAGLVRVGHALHEMASRAAALPVIAKVHTLYLLSFMSSHWPLSQPECKPE